MSTIGFVSYEIHPTTWGGCGVLLHHAASRLLEQGHDVVFLLDVPLQHFHRFNITDRLTLPHARRCRAYHVDTLCEDFLLTADAVPGTAMWKSLRFAHAYRKWAAIERMDFVEFFEYCGVGYHTMVERLFGRDPDGPVLGARLHNSIELIDHYGSTKVCDLDRRLLYGLEHGALSLAEVVLTPTLTYFNAYYRDRYAIPPAKAVESQSPKLEFPRVTRRPSPGAPFRIVYMGRLVQFKGVDQVVHAALRLMARRPELNFTVELIGPDSRESPLGESYVEYLRTLIPRALRRRFAFTGHVPHERMIEHLNEALFAVFPNRFESFCYAAHEVYDAGVPMIVRDLPGWSDFFTHERNALVYDGSLDALVASMERMIDDDALRESLARPYPIADRPLGDYYANPVRRAPLSSAQHDTGLDFEPLVLVLQHADAADEAGLTATLKALAEQTHRDMRIVVLREGARDDGPTLWLLGRPWTLQAGHPRDTAADLVTADALAILEAGDQPAPGWLQRCVTAMRNRSSLGFAGTWHVWQGRPVVSTLDVAPEAYPFHMGAARTRALIRTTPGLPLIEWMDPDLGPLGEIGCLWKAVDRWGMGCLYPHARIQVADGAPKPVEPGLVQCLIDRYGRPFAGRLAALTVLLHQRADTPARASQPSEKPDAATPWPEVSVDYKLRLANELGGRDLMKMALRKAARRMRVEIGRGNRN